MASRRSTPSRAWGLEPAGGLVVAPAAGSAPHPRLPVVAGDHPEPGPGSLAAAEALGERRPGWGRTTRSGCCSRAAPPACSRAPGRRRDSGRAHGALRPAARLRSRHHRHEPDPQALLPLGRRTAGPSARPGAGAGLRRVRRHRRRPASIGSGPCVPDPTTAAEVRRLLDAPGSGIASPPSPGGVVTAVGSGETPETPKPGDPAFARVTLELIASNRLALEAAAKRAAELGLAPEVAETPLAGEASTTGASVAASLLQNCGPPEIPQPAGAGRCFIWGGETTVTLGDAPPGPRRALSGAGARRGPRARRRAGRRGAAGGRHRRSRRPDRRRRRDRGRRRPGAAIGRAGGIRRATSRRTTPIAALDAAGALLKMGLTGTNVMDIVIGVVKQQLGDRT